MKKENWKIEGPRKIDKHSVINSNHYLSDKIEFGTLTKVIDNKKWEEI